MEIEEKSVTYRTPGIARQDGFITESMVRTFVTGAIILMTGLSMYIFGFGFYRGDNSTIVNVLTAVGWAGFILVLSSVGYMVWKYRRVLFT